MTIAMVVLWEPDTRVSHALQESHYSTGRTTSSPIASFVHDGAGIWHWLHFDCAFPSSGRCFGSRKSSNPQDITQLMHLKALLEHVQKTNFVNYVKGSDFASAMQCVFGQGMFVSDGHQWYAARKTASHIFSRRNFRNTVNHAVQENLNRLQALLLDHARTGAAFDLSRLFQAFMLSTFVKLAFGVDLDNLAKKDPLPFETAFEEIQHIIAQRFGNPLWPVTEQFTGAATRARKCTQIIDDFAYSIIDQREQMPQEQSDCANPTDLLALLKSTKSSTGRPLVRKELRDAVLNLIVAGRDTTAEALSWTFFYIVRDNCLQHDLVKELVEADQGDVDFDNHKRLALHAAAFHESLRLRPSVPMNMRQALEDDVLPNGVHIRKGERVFWSDYNLGRSEKVWGENAAEYRPSRWLDKNDRFVRPSQWTFHAFNAGPRRCLGENLAIYQAVAVMGTCLRHFEFNFAPGYYQSFLRQQGEDVPLPADSITCPMRDPIMLVVKRRADVCAGPALATQAHDV